MNAYRRQQLRAAVLIEQGATAEQIAEVFGWTKSRAAPEQIETGDKRTLTPRRKCGIIKAIRRHVRRWKRKQEGKKMKWTNIWKVMYNPTGYGAVPYYFNSKEEAEKFANRDYADVPKRVAASESGDIPITVYKTAENADKDKGHTEYI